MLSHSLIMNYKSLKRHSGVGERAQWVRELIARADNLRERALGSRLHKEVSLTSTCTLCHMYMSARSHTHVIKYIYHNNIS